MGKTYNDIQYEGMQRKSIDQLWQKNITWNRPRLSSFETHGSFKYLFILPEYKKKFQNFSYERFSFMNLLNKKKTQLWSAHGRESH